ncbi:MAG TPA: hypothetical protein VFI84_02485 [Candidatus Saccharimonadales bacterium]|nr:hypothetical protein [Candidatus Saccharimonadales bacterium]
MYRSAHEQQAPVIEKLDDHRAAFIALHAITDTFSIRNAVHINCAAGLLEDIDPRNSDWTTPTVVRAPGKSKALEFALKKARDTNNGSWLSDQARIMLLDLENRHSESDIVLPTPRVGEMAVQGVMF